MGPRELSKLGLIENDLIPVEMKLGGANGSQLKIIGGVFLSISGTDAAGKLWETGETSCATLLRGWRNFF